MGPPYVETNPGWSMAIGVMRPWARQKSSSIPGLSLKQASMTESVCGTSGVGVDTVGMPPSRCNRPAMGGAGPMLVGGKHSAVW
jgi:hypothetical protein